MTKMVDNALTPRHGGLIIHAAARYDFLVWLATLGREPALRKKIVRLAKIQTGETVLDVCCGTGAVAIVAKRAVGPSGGVYGIDASSEMLARAERKTKRAGLQVKFKIAFAQELPFPDAHFDAVLGTMMLHHLPRKARKEWARETLRVLKPGGRVLAVDFARVESKQRGVLERFHRHGHANSEEVIALLEEAGLRCVESGELGINDLHYALAIAPSDRNHHEASIGRRS